MNETLLPVRHASKATAEVWRFVFEYGWATFTICNATGEFSIQSDWGNYSHRWDPRQICLGEKDLKTFIARGSYHYLANKFSYENKQDLGPVIDGAASVANLRRRIVEWRRDHGPADDMARAEARHLWDAADSIRGYRSPDELYLACRDGEVDAKLVEFILEHFDTTSGVLVEGRSPRYRFLTEQLLPFFCARLREEIGVAEARA